MLTIPTHEKIINETNVGIISQNYLSYTDSDHETWRKLCSRHTLSHKKMSKEYVDGFEILGLDVNKMSTEVRIRPPYQDKNISSDTK